MMHVVLQEFVNNFPCVFIGVVGIAVIQLTEIKDVMSILVGVVTMVCLIHTAFFRGRKKKCK